jgi:hypothetical protein
VDCGSAFKSHGNKGYIGSQLKGWKLEKRTNIFGFFFQDVAHAIRMELEELRGYEHIACMLELKRALEILF